MKYRKLLMLTLGSIGALAIAQTTVEPSSVPVTHAGGVKYHVTDLGPAGPPPGQPYSIAATGLAAGAAPGSNGDMHAFLWYGKSSIDIGTRGLGGPNNMAFGVNASGQVVGAAQTTSANAEDFCGFNAYGLKPSATACAAFVWQNGITSPLSTLGGANAVANLINNRGEIVGFAENGKVESNCPVGQFKPVVWRGRAIQELPTLKGDPDGGAYSINDSGQIVGTSGSCAPFNPNAQNYMLESHAVLWENGAAIDLGSFGGTGGFAGNHACAINNRGQVVGHSDVTGDTTTHAFLWTRESKMQPLLPLAGDFASLALNINDRGQVVGSSFNTDFVFRAFLWENGVMTDLNQLAPDSPLTLQLASSINAGGEIVGFGQTPDGEVHGFLATPNNGGESLSSGRHVTPLRASEKARQLLYHRLGIRTR
jgi:probable HAF family extracellular repeat protein